MKKTNKTFKRFAAITSASLLAACAMAPAIVSAVDIKVEGFTTTNANDTTAHEFEAYQIFDGDISGENKVLINIKWGTGINPGENNANYQLLLNDLAAAADVFKENNAPFVYSATNDESAEKVADALATAGTALDTELAKKFADVVAKYLTTDATKKKLSHVVTADEAVDEDVEASISGGTYAKFDEGDVIIPGLDDGYYLIQDQERSDVDVNGENNGAMTRYILRVTDNDPIDVQAKASAPTVMKKVKEDDSYTVADKVEFNSATGGYQLDAGYNDVADYSIGDAVPFKLYGTMPSTLDDYDHYYYKFTDTLGSQFNAPTNVKITIEGTTLYYKANGVDVGGGVYKWSYIQYTDATFETATSDGDKDNNCSLEYDGTNFTIAFKDIKDYTDVDKETVVTVEYNAVLNESAKIGYEGQLNKVDITYSNNPNEEYKPWDDDGNVTTDTPDSTGTTKEDGVIVFTYGFDINKYENGNTGDKLKDAQFAIYYYDTDEVTKKYLVVENGLFKGTTVAEPTAASKSIWTSTETDNIVIKGLDAGKYYIQEIAPPAGYNPLGADVEVIVSSTYTDNTIQTGDNSVQIYTQDWTYNSDANYIKDGEGTVTGYTAMDKISVGYSNNIKEQNGDTLATVDIENKKGTSLPGTGGIGTTIFYLGGGAMAAIGGIYLISKRRMRKSEE